MKITKGMLMKYEYIKTAVKKIAYEVVRKRIKRFCKTNWMTEKALQSKQGKREVFERRLGETR
jgi:hypothetical protein